MTDTPNTVTQPNQEAQTPTSFSTENQKEIILTDEKLAEIKKDLAVIIDTLPADQSWFSRAAHFWGPIPVWQKMIVGTILTIPLLVIGIVLNIAALIATSIVAIVIYCSQSILLDNHYERDKQNADKLKIRINSMANALGLVIQSLQKVHQQFAAENNRLASHVGELSEQNKVFKEQTELLGETQKQFTALQTELDQTHERYKETENRLENTSQKLKANQGELEQTSEHLRETELKLIETERELTQIKERFVEIQSQFANQVAKLEGQNDTLNDHLLKAKALVANLSQVVTGSEAQQKQFQERIDLIFTEGGSFSKIFQGMSQAERDLQNTQRELLDTKNQFRELQLAHARNNARHEELLKRHEEEHQVLVNRLQELQPSAIAKAPSSISAAQILSNIGLLNSKVVQGEPNIKNARPEHSFN